MTSGNYTWEWAVETIDAYGDIVDTNYYETLAEAADFALFVDAGERAEIVLVATESAEVSGLADQILDRSWAYLLDSIGTARPPLPTHTTGGLRSLKVPNRFHAEAAEAAKR
jgi:hypothetical protein